MAVRNSEAKLRVTDLREKIARQNSTWARTA
jgi:hypothetical protein